MLILKPFEEKIRIGNETHFWKDKLYEDLVLKDVFPYSYKIESNKNCKVNERLLEIGRDGVFWCWSRRLRKEEGCGFFAELNKKIMVVCLSLVLDLWLWQGNLNGYFLVTHYEVLWRRLIQLMVCFHF